MRNQTIGVSLPQKNEVDFNSKLDIFTEKNIVSVSHLKNDFEKALKKSSHKDDIKLDNKTDKSKKDHNSEFNLETKKSKQSSGTNKKKMTERKDSSISNNMASPENVIEIPDEKNDLALEEVQIQEGAAHSIQNSLKNENMNNGFLSKIQLDENLNHFENNSIELSSDNDLEQVSQSEFNLEFPLNNKNESQIEISSNTVDPLETYLSNSDNSIPIELRNSMNNELAEQVGYRKIADDPNLELNLVNQLQKFEVEKGIQPEAIKPFELAVFQQLQQLNDQRLIEAHLQKQKYSSIDSTLFSDQLNVNDTSANSIAYLSNSNSLQSSENELFDGENSNSDNHKDQSSDSSFVDFKKESTKDDSLHIGQSQQSFRNELSNSSFPELKLDSSIHNSSNIEDHLDQNIKEIMNKSHFLAKAGGGEMHLKMSPDGLSEVHLKVILNDGRVNIEIQTQDRTLKKLIEESLSELKSGLSNQQLKVDHVRIDTVMPTQTDNTTQFQFKEKNNQSDHKQRELWNELQNSISTKGLTSGHKKDYSNNSLPEKSSLRTYGGTKGSQFNKVA